MTVPSGVIPIAIINESTILQDSAVIQAVAALQKQITRDFYPVWSINTELEFFSKGNVAKIPSFYWWLVILDDSDQAGALGYHDLTTNNKPMGKIFAKTDKTYSSSWTVTMSHEILEMLGDPMVNQTVFLQSSNTAGVLYAWENCDPVEDDSFGYEIDGILLSDFITPEWFNPWMPPVSSTSGPSKTRTFDFCRHCTSPLQILKGGYASIFNVGSGSGWTQQINQESLLDAKLRRNIGSRFERRRLPYDRWITSTVAK